MRQRMEMFTATVGVPGHRQIIQNTIHLLQHNHLQQNLQRSLLQRRQQQINLLQHNLLKQKAVVPALIPNPVDQRLPARCRALPATGRGVVPAQVPGAVVAEPVVVEVAGVEAAEEEVVALEEEEEDNRLKQKIYFNVYRASAGKQGIIYR
jgi:hypothetical protein